MASTISERLFESFCCQAGVRWRRIPESSERRPDYEIFPHAVRVFVEVKQLDPNAEEKLLAARRARGEVVAFGSTPGERIRRQVREANPQLKRLASGKSPTLVVIFNNTDCHLHTDPYGVMTAMMGIDTVDVSVPVNPCQSPTFGPTYSGKQRGMRPDANTTISGIAVLRADDPASLYLDLFHNRFARCPLAPRVFRSLHVRQFCVPANASNSLIGWQEV